VVDATNQYPVSICTLEQIIRHGADSLPHMVVATV